MQGLQESEKVQTMSLVDIIHKAIAQLKIPANLDVSKVIGVSRTEDGWLLSIEVIERKAIPDTQDLLGTYEVHLDNTVKGQTRWSDMTCPVCKGVGIVSIRLPTQSLSRVQRNGSKQYRQQAILYEV